MHDAPVCPHCGCTQEDYGFGLNGCDLCGKAFIYEFDCSLKTFVSYKLEKDDLTETEYPVCPSCHNYLYGFDQEPDETWRTKAVCEKCKTTYVIAHHYDGEYSTEVAKTILDVACGSRMFYFDKNDPRVMFCDIRQESHVLCDGRKLEIKPDVVCDFRDLPFANEQFKTVVFDPPHLEKVGKNSWMFKKYGGLSQSWREDLRLGFKECFRVLEADGTLIFKWNETQIKTSEIIKLAEYAPVFGHISGKQSKTHWVCFVK